MSKVASKALQAVLDVALLAIVFMVACGLRFDWNVPREVLERCFLLLPYVVAIKYLFLYRFDVPRFAWRYVGLREVTRIFYALSSASAFLLLVRFVAVPMRKHARWLDETWIPTGIILIDFILAFCAIVGIRALRRVHSERRRRAFLSSGPSSEVEAVPTLLIGAGQAGLAVARDIYRHPNLRIKPVGFLDDDRSSDLLGREPVQLSRHRELIARAGALNGEAISDAMVDGHGRGRQHRLRALPPGGRFGPETARAGGAGENALFEIHRELLRRAGGRSLMPVIGDICDDRRMRRRSRSTSPEACSTPRPTSTCR
jgi:FlaA1/EpsC-like NDP-sugar epimerase